MKGFIASVFLIGALALSGCGFSGFKIVTGSGNVIEENRAVSGFDAVKMSGSGDLYIIQGDEEGLRIEAEENLLPYIRSEVRGHTLHIYLDHTDFLSIDANRPMRFYVSMKEVTGLDLSGSGTISSDSITTKDLEINISGSGDIEVEDLQAGNLTADISGSGSCKFKGQAGRQQLIISGSGRCDNSALESKDVDIDISGSGNTSVIASDTLNVTISGSGDVTYQGNPKITQKISGSGNLISK